MELFEQYADERSSIHVRVSQEVCVLTKEEEAAAIAKFEALKVENAKLRELVWDMYKWLWNGADCTECPFTAECDLNAAFESDLHAHICIGWSKIHDRMRELGVEVDDG